MQLVLFLAPFIIRLSFYVLLFSVKYFRSCLVIVVYQLGDLFLLRYEFTKSIGSYRNNFREGGKTTSINFLSSHRVSAFLPENVFVVLFVLLVARFVWFVIDWLPTGVGAFAGAGL